ncbi:CAP domain-containing protein [Dyadobacter sp. CY261]|nr:CAP domain-containing protein [Dyadobacter sp. CY261]
METLIVFVIYWYSQLCLDLHKKQYYSLEESRFFALPKSEQLIPLNNPDTLFLDAAVFHASNEVRRKYGLPAFRYDPGLYLASSGHATSMVYRTFFNHTNPYSPYERTAQRRVELYTKRFIRIGENIGKYQTLVSGDYMVARWKRQENEFEFLNESDRRPCVPFTYAAYARFVVEQWMASPPHRSNLMNPAYVYLGCAARLSPEPFKHKKVPYASLVQNFGGEQ